MYLGSSILQHHAEQKNELRLRAEGNPKSQMTPERERKLVAAGLTFRGRDAVWAQRIQSLEAYKAQHGHCRVPYSYLDDPQLAKWVMKQRGEMKALKEGKKSQLTDVRIAQLDGLGFWDSDYHAIVAASVSLVASNAASSAGTVDPEAAVVAVDAAAAVDNDVYADADETVYADADEPD